MRSLRILALAGACLLSTGCALTYPIVGHDLAQYAGDSLEAQNSTHLITNEAMYPRYQIRAGSLKSGDREVCEIPEGTPIEFHSFWHASRIRALGAPIRTDYALVTVETPGMGRVTAELPMEDLGAVFDGRKQRSKSSSND